MLFTNPFLLEAKPNLLLLHPPVCPLIVPIFSFLFSESILLRLTPTTNQSAERRSTCPHFSLHLLLPVAEWQLQVKTKEKWQLQLTRRRSLTANMSAHKAALLPHMWFRSSASVWERDDLWAYWVFFWINKYIKGSRAGCKSEARQCVLTISINLQINCFFRDWISDVRFW